MSPGLPPLPDDAGLTAYLDAATALHGIPVDPAWRPEMLANMKAIAGAARLVLSFPLDDEADLAPVFRP
ncbi:DUF4089 domain-containing protein [Muricoccus radiodurans]|uniref:DUF4089 domain-containing protein n=1 Tax=Muricoccus radiodurans TaxID=2231721 RepID=UPI003CE7A80C